MSIVTFVEGPRDFLGHAQLDGVGGQEPGGTVVEDLVHGGLTLVGLDGQGSLDVVQRPRVLLAAEIAIRTRLPNHPRATLSPSAPLTSRGNSETHL